MKFKAIEDQNEALAAVTQNGYTLQYVKEYKVFLSIANELNIAIEK